jgi:hypothetical protein
MKCSALQDAAVILNINENFEFVAVLLLLLEVLSSSSLQVIEVTFHQALNQLGSLINQD